MDNIVELKIKITKIISSSKLPDEIKQKLENIYLDYEDSCKECEKSLMRIGNSQKIENIINYINKDRYDMYDFINTIAKEEYDIKNSTMTDEIVNQLETLKRESKELKPILFDSKEEEKRSKENNTLEHRIEKTVINDNKNRRYVKSLLGAIESEIQSSKKEVKVWLDEIKEEETSFETKLNISKIVGKWEDNIEAIIKKAKKEIPEISGILEEQERSIYKYIENTIQEYKENKKDIKKSTFRESLAQGVNIDEKKALQDANEKASEINEKKGLEPIL